RGVAAHLGRGNILGYRQRRGIRRPSAVMCREYCTGKSPARSPQHGRATESRRTGSVIGCAVDGAFGGVVTASRGAAGQFQAAGVSPWNKFMQTAQSRRDDTIQARLGCAVPTGLAALSNVFHGLTPVAKVVTPLRG